MTADEAFQADAQSILGDFPHDLREVTWNGSTYSCNFDAVDFTRSVREEGVRERLSLRLQILRSLFAGGDIPKAGDLFEFDGTTYRAASVICGGYDIVIEGDPK